MLELIRLELKKICRRKLTIIVTLSCLLATTLFFTLPYLQYKAWDENGKMLSMREAVSYKKSCYEKISGSLTEERITADLHKYQALFQDEKNLIKERGGEVTFNDTLYYGYIAPQSSYLGLLGENYCNLNESLGYDKIPQISLSEGAKFYETRNSKVNEIINSSYFDGKKYTAAEKAFWLKRKAEIKEPYNYGYVLGWSNFGDTAQMLIICIFGICIVVAPVFSNEYQTGTAAVILSTRYGKSKIVWAKIITATLFGTVIFAMNAFISLAIPLITFGIEGGDLPLQIMNMTVPYALTFSDAAYIMIGIGYLVMLGLLSITLLFSARMRSSFTVLIIDVLLVFLPIFLGLSGSNHLWNQLLRLLPYQALSGLSLFKEYISYPFGGIILSLYAMIAIVYASISLLSLPFAGRSFSRYQA